MRAVAASIIADPEKNATGKSNRTKERGQASERESARELGRGMRAWAEAC